MNLKDTIAALIDSKREGNYWDFKSEPHDNNASLLHDIISLSNSIAHTNRYLILGVSDPKEGCKIIGLTKGQKNRKSQTELIDFLRFKKFAADLRPEVELKTLQFDTKEVDLIIISDKPHKPYFLTEDYSHQGKIARGNYIYTWIQDTNTPIDKSADLYNVELMWKERFGLTVPPYQRFKLILLEHNNWFLDPGNKNYAYYKPEPEYKIEFGEVKDGHEPYELYFLNPNFIYGELKLLYHSTILHESEFIWLDGMRLFSTAPNTGSIKLKNATIYYYYLILMEIDGLLHGLFQDGKLSCSSRGHDSNFIYFINPTAKNEFDNYVIMKEYEFWETAPTHEAIEANKMLNAHKEMGNTVDLENVNRIHQIWLQWHDHNITQPTTGPTM